MSRHGLYVQPWRVTWPDGWGFYCTWREAMERALAVAASGTRVRVVRLGDAPAIRNGIPVRQTANEANPAG